MVLHSKAVATTKRMLGRKILLFRAKSAFCVARQQQAVAIGRALLSNPDVLLIDELSLGLAPSIIARIYGMIPRVVETGCSVLFVEQNVAQALSVADRALCLLEGRTVLTGVASELERSEVEDAYFGVAHGRGGRKERNSDADS